MPSADHIGKGTLLNVTGVTLAQTSETFMDAPRTSDTVICVYSSAASGPGSGTGAIFEVAAPTKSEDDTPVYLEFTTEDVAAGQIVRYVFPGGLGSNARVRITPDGSSDIKVWAWSSY